MNVLFFKINLLLLLSSASLAMPLSPIQLVARSGLYSGFQMPPRTFALNSSVALNNSGQISFNVVSVDGRANSGIWYGNLLGGKIVAEQEEGFLSSDPQMNEKGQITFEIFDELSSKGIFTINPTSNELSQIYKPNDIFNLNLASYSFLSSAGDLFFLGMNSERQRALVSRIDGTYNKFAEQERGISYIFSPSFNENRIAVSKVRLGESGDWNEKQPDQIRKWDANGQYSVIAEDVDSNSDSKFLGFANSVHVNQIGDVVFRAELVSGGSGIFIFSARENKTTEVVTTKNSIISEIEHFNIKMNNLGHVAFRAKDKKGLRGVYFYDGKKLALVLQEGQELVSDLGPVQIFYEKDHPGFGGSPALNDHDEIAILLTTVDPKHHNETYSKAVYLIRPSLNKDSYQSFLKPR